MAVTLVSSHFDKETPRTSEEERQVHSQRSAPWPQWLHCGRTQQGAQQSTGDPDTQHTPQAQRTHHNENKYKAGAQGEADPPSSPTVSRWLLHRQGGRQAGRQAGRQGKAGSQAPSCC